MDIKPWLSLEEQISLLVKRGLADAPQFAREIETIGYYRLSGYTYPLRQVGPSGGKNRLDDFISGARFSDVFELYRFDVGLRQRALSALATLEVTFRADIGNIFGKLDPYIHLDLGQYLPKPNKSESSKYKPNKRELRLQKFEKKYADSLEYSSEDFVAHYTKKYGGRLPIWAAVSILDFGQLVTLYSLGPFEERSEIARLYGVRADQLESWMRTLNYIRNVCAHHARLWNKSVVISPSAKDRQDVPDLAQILDNPKTVYASLSILVYLLKRSTSDMHREELREHLKNFPCIQGISLRDMGAPENWDTHPLWKE